MTEVHDIAALPLFRGAPDWLVSAAVAGSELRELAAGETLLKAGTENSMLFILLSGSVTVRIPRTSRPRLRLGAGDCVGELSLIDGRHVSADVVVAEPAVVLAIDRDHLWSLVEKSADVARNLLRILVGRVRDDNAALSDASRLQRRYRRIATVDGLTGLRNRRWLKEAFARQLERARRTGQATTLLMIDVDHFKQVNDEHGHRAGDAVLRRLARALAARLRPQDLLARYGGEEFVVLLPGLGAAAAWPIAERLRKEVAAEARVPAHAPVAVTVSIGLAALQPGDTLDALVKRADEALYRAKEAGRNRTRE